MLHVPDLIRNLSLAPDHEAPDQVRGMAVLNWICHVSFPLQVLIYAA